MTKGKGKNPGSGGLNKHIKREAHKERQQLGWRKQLGALEKHQDYARRAKRRHDKVSKMQELKRAAAQRNPDEYNIKMAKTILDVATGRVRQRGTKRPQRDELVAMVAQNASNSSYLLAQARRDKDRAGELLAEVSVLDARAECQHTVFVDDEDAYENFDAVQYFNTVPELLQYPAQRGNVDRLGARVADESVAASLPAIKSKNERRRERAQKLQSAVSVRGGDASEIEVGEDEAEAERALLVAQAANEAAERHQGIARKLKEATQRVARAEKLERLAKGVSKESSAIKNRLKVRESNKIRHGTTRVRSR